MLPLFQWRKSAIHVRPARRGEKESAQNENDANIKIGQIDSLKKNHGRFSGNGNTILHILWNNLLKKSTMKIPLAPSNAIKSPFDILDSYIQCYLTSIFRVSQRKKTRLRHNKKIDATPTIKKIVLEAEGSFELSGFNWRLHYNIVDAFAGVMGLPWGFHYVFDPRSCSRDVSEHLSSKTVPKSIWKTFGI